MSGKKVDRVWIVIGVDDDGDEGVAAVLVGKQWFPLVAADAGRLESVRKMASELVKDTGRVLTLRYADALTDVEVFEP